jgi:hypothetical protein
MLGKMMKVIGGTQAYMAPTWIKVNSIEVQSNGHGQHVK